MQSLYGLVAQLDRAPDYGSGGWGFDSSLVHELNEAAAQNHSAAAFFFNPFPPTNLKVPRRNIQVALVGVYDRFFQKSVLLNHGILV